MKFINKIIRIILIYFLTFVFAQTQNQIKQVKEYIEKPGMSEAEVKAAGKLRGYSESQINKVLNMHVLLGAPQFP